MEVQIVIDTTIAKAQALIRTPHLDEQTAQAAHYLQQLGGGTVQTADVQATGAQAPDTQTAVIPLAAAPPAVLPKSILAACGSEVHILKLSSIVRFEASGQHVLAYPAASAPDSSGRTTAGGLRVKQRLYELQELLQGSTFVRISNSEIANFEAVESLDMSIAEPWF